MKTKIRLFIQQVQALLWRNYVLKKSNKVKTIAEFLLPSILMVCLGHATKVVKKGQESKADDQPVYISHTPNIFVSDSYRSNPIMFAPNTKTVKDVANNVVWSLNKVQSLKSYCHEMHENVSSINKAYQTNSSHHKVAVIFDDDPLQNGSYTIKMPAASLPFTNKLYIGTKSLCRDNDESLMAACPTLAYYYHGFSNLQRAVDSALLKLWSGGRSISVPSAGLYFLPRGGFKVSSEILESLVPLYLVIGFTPLISFLSTYIALEKEKRIKQAMLVMGMKISAYWVSWLLTEFCVVLFTSVATVFIIYDESVFSSSSVFVVFFLMLLSGISTIMIAFMITPFFNKHMVAGSVSGFAVLIFSLLYLLAIFLKGKLSCVVFHITTLVSPAASALAFVKLLQNGPVDNEISSSNFFSVGSGIIMRFVDVILFGLLAYYFDNVIPGEYGTWQSPWFCFLPEFWYKDPNVPSRTNDMESELTNTSEKDVEEVSDDLKAKNVVKIRGLTKIYSKVSQTREIPAVNNFSLDIYEGQITALIGHNGAGKSTLINMLVGALEPTDGTAWIYGKNIKNAQDISKLRSKIGVCFQEDILFDDMNAREHLEFFAWLKDLPAGERKTCVDELLSELEFTKSAYIKSIHLSGGRKRQVSVAIALIGDPKLLVLDEPSSGLDPHSRRKVWALLASHKEDRVIILTTHSMYEADILADRKVIVSNGKIRCAGSSLYLKEKFGVGYHLTINVDESNCTKVTDVIQGVIPTAQLYRITASEFCYTLPRDETPHFPHLFDVLDEEIKSGLLHIVSYGVSMTTLEEVFLRVAEEDTNDGSNDESAQEYMGVHGDASSDINFVSTTAYEDSVFPSCVAYIKARLLLVKRNTKGILLIPIMTIVILILTYFLMKNGSNISSALQCGPLTLTPSVYPSVPFKLFNNTGTSLEDFVIALEDQGLVVDYLSSALPTLHDVNYTDFLAAVLDQYHPNKDLVEWKWMFNSDYQHALPILQSIMSNAFWASIDSKTNQLPRRLVTTFDPFPLTRADALKGFDPNTYFFVLFVGVLFAYIPTEISVDVVEDRANKLKNQLKVSGFGYFSYWSTTLAVHSILFLIDIIFFTTMLSFMGIPFMKNPSVALIVWLLSLLFVPTSLLCCYVIFHLFNKPETAKSMVNLLCCLLTTIFSTVVMMLDSFGMKQFATALHYIFGFLFPLYVPPGTLYYLLIAVNTQEYLSHFGLPTSNRFYFEWGNHVIVCFVMMAFQIVALNVVLRIADTLKSGGNLNDAFCHRADESDLVVVGESNSEELDDDIVKERAFVKQCKQGVQMPVLIDRLYKVYKWRSGKPCRKVEKTKIAVKNLSLAVRSGNIFGLLGPNGAGKTSTLKMIVGEEKISSGSISVLGHNISCSSVNDLRVLGYCPQYDALWKKLTVREHLNLYAVIKGYHPTEVDAVCRDIIDALRITEHADKRVEELSGGTKRKLSYAISILGRSEIILLDEPSTGMDPQSKKYFWNTIIKFFPSMGAKSAVLTTHSIEEAEVLCSRVGLMVKASLRFLGPIQHLKFQYGQEYSLDINVVTSSSSYEEVHEYIMNLLPSAVNKGSSEHPLSYTVAKEDVPLLSAVFSSLEKAKNELRIIEDYSFGLVTLEQIFLGLIKKYHCGN